MTRRTLAIVPVKRLTSAKSRLVPALGNEARARLVLLMLEDVLATLAGVPQLDGVLVVTADAEVSRAARASGAEVIGEEGSRGLNAAVETGLNAASARGAQRALIVPADVPLATESEIARLIESPRDERDPGIVLAPSFDGAGTNGLALPLGTGFVPRFGTDSFFAHLSEAVARRRDVAVLHLPGLARDIDQANDLDYLTASPWRKQRYADFARRNSFEMSFARKPAWIERE